MLVANCDLTKGIWLAERCRIVGGGGRRNGSASAKVEVQARPGRRGRGGRGGG